MRTFTDQQRYVVVLGDAADEVSEAPTVTVLDRLDRVVLLEASYRTAVELRHRDGVIIHIYERERDARRAFGLFVH
ncbi:MAG TPA: hypothetical protein VE646_11390 [Actinomycetota bacterium]|jgi:hypothetical protein|nr:hypothetical protein [Actinomycetota bacterium]